MIMKQHIQKLATTISFASFILLAGGCAQDPFGPLADSILGKDRHQQPSVSGAAESKTSSVAKGTTARFDSQEPVCKTSKIISSSDVDTAYARAMRSYQFRTWEQRKKDAERLGAIDSGFKHDATPGAYYHLADYVTIIGTSGQQYISFMNLELAREGATKTAVSAKYCVPSNLPSSNDPQLFSSIDKSIRTVLR